ncbi:long-chain fatty acid transport protein [Sphingobacterium allocomposti]|uniref:Long-chain fatty acid transport protein n=1 Tax=Sphingobacterium allocomposti TaxID=415956 RepID=A0A5S5DJD2_9SPHI|nr:outer membrane protein transport protein [Sphingobacterium composti Yoo et al. 2007 non Ten et al. 2007]TYP96017.1 long-chain fatty acid transport protein [Sphingobacterium composti Yoo et al. 2007 non Ten et al. 2007]
MKKILLGLLLASPGILWAQGSQVNTQSQKAVGMAGAGSALFIDEASIFYSPGALAKMDHNALSVGASGVMYRSAFRELNSNDVHHTKFKITPPFAVFAALGPKNSWWKAGIGVYTPFGGSVDWGDQWPGRYELNHLQMRAIYIQPTLSFKLTENFGIGGGFVYNVGFVDLSRSIPAAGADGQPGRAELSGVGTGMGFNLGVHYHLEDNVAISLSYRSKVVTKLKDGDAEFTVPPALAASFPNTTFNAELPLPASFNFGISFPASDRVDIAADATFIGYSIYKELNFDYKDNTPALTDTRQIKKYENALSAKVGVNYQTTDRLALRAGAGYVYTPVRGPYVSPETPDNNRLMGSVGFTYDINDKWDITGAYVFQQLMERTVASAATGLTGTYKTNIHAPGLSLTYKW